MEKRITIKRKERTLQKVHWISYPADEKIKRQTQHTRKIIIIKNKRLHENSILVPMSCQNSHSHNHCQLKDSNFKGLKAEEVLVQFSSNSEFPKIGCNAS